jgi:hypothetical protein
VNVDYTLLHLYGLIGQHRSALEWDSTLGYRHLSQRHETALRGINIGDLGVQSYGGTFVLIILVCSFAWP